MTTILRTTQTGQNTSAASWDLRHPGLIMQDGSGEMHEFTGMWLLKPDADLVGLLGHGRAEKVITLQQVFGRHAIAVQRNANRKLTLP